MKITTSVLCIGLVATSAFLSSCATRPQLTQEQIFSQHQQVATLESALKQAKTKDAELLAPEGYAKANLSLDRAMTAARDNESEVADAAAIAGLKTVDKMNLDAKKSREILAEVLSARDRAYKAGANTQQAEKVTVLDEGLKRTSALIENGDIEAAKQRRPKLMADYSQLELAALKQGTVDQAKSAIANAQKQDAEDYAPKTLKQAEDEMALATSVLDADRTQTEKANVHAKNTKYLAEKSASITETIKDFERRDYTNEDIVLWHQQQLKSINEPLGGELPFNESNDEVMLGLKNSVSTVVAERQLARDELQKAERDAQNRLLSASETNTALASVSGQEMEKMRLQHEEELAQLRIKYEKQLAMNKSERAALEEKERQEHAKFATVQAMFDDNEAKVFQQRKNVLISAQGFKFPPGQSEIQTSNFPLMNKIVRAIKTFPNARIEVRGHTDSTGNDTKNQQLSEERAEKVAKFLVEVGDIPPANVKSSGFGESKPVASNETQDGRAENRRVEIAIINE